MPASSPRSALFADGRSRVLWFCLLGWIFDLHDLVLFSFTKGLVARDLGMSLSTLAWIEGAARPLACSPTATAGVAPCR